MWTILNRLNTNGVLAIPAMMFAGFAFGIWFDAGFLKGLIIPFTFLMVYPMMVTLKLKKGLEGGDGKAQLLAQLINFTGVPLAAFGLGKLFFPDQPYLALGLLLAALVPTSGMTISWTGFAKGNLAAAVKMTVVGLIFGSLATPFYVRAMMGAQVEVDLANILTQIVLIIFLPMAAGYATQQGLIRRYGQQRFQEDWTPNLPSLSGLGVLGIVFIAIALVYDTVMRNLSIALAVAINAFGPAGSETALVISLAYIVQVKSAAWYVKFSEQISGAQSAPITATQA